MLIRKTIGLLVNEYTIGPEKISKISKKNKTSLKKANTQSRSQKTMCDSLKANFLSLAVNEVCH